MNGASPTVWSKPPLWSEGSAEGRRASTAGADEPALDTVSDREIVIHALDHAEAALAAAAALRLPVTLASAPGAAAQAGPAWFKALIEAASVRHPDVTVTAILDCGDEPGAVMAALRAGLRELRFSGSDELRTKLRELGAVFHAPMKQGESLDLRSVAQPEKAVRAFLARG
jgi:Fructose-bisphosphate aldolase class-II